MYKQQILEALVNFTLCAVTFHIHICIYIKVKVNDTLVQALSLCSGRTAHTDSRGIALLFLDRGTRRSEGSASRPGRSLPPGKTRYLLYRRLGWPQGRSGQAGKISLPPGFDPRIVQPVASRYTNYPTRTTKHVDNRKNGRGVTLTPHSFQCNGQERVELCLYSPYEPYGLYRASVSTRLHFTFFLIGLSAYRAVNTLHLVYRKQIC